MTSNPEFNLRPGTREDTFSTFRIFYLSVNDLMVRQGVTPAVEIEPDEIARVYKKNLPLVEHLYATAEYFWVAETDQEIVGFARSTLRDGMLELTEFFLLPGVQSRGVGRQLLEKVFPREGTHHQRCIIATTSTSAMARYLKAGVTPHFPIVNFSKEITVDQLEAPEQTSRLELKPLDGSPAQMDILARIDREILGHRRDVDHHWIRSQRPGFLYYQDQRLLGYGYVGKDCGPFALLEPQSFPQILSHAERLAAEKGFKVYLEAPLVNRQAVDYLLSHGYRMDPFLTVFMCDGTPGKFDQYICTSPPFFI